MESAISKAEAERAEVEEVLSSGVLGRTNNLVRLMTYVCEKYFDGATDDIKEYNIAVHALGRREGFDPQVDTIVRVTAHALRKRLEEYYKGPGAEHPIHICLPTGRYIPKFTHLNSPEGSAAETKPEVGHNGHSGEAHPARAVELPLDPNEGSGAHPSAGPADATAAANHAAGGAAHVPPTSRTRYVATSLFLLAVIAALAFFSWKKWPRGEESGISPPVQAAAVPGAGAGAVTAGAPGKILRVAMGDLSAPLVDRGGAEWLADQYCTGGSAFTVGGHTILGTEDSPLFSSGRKGIFRCSYPASPGTYEVHLLFAETDGLQENSRNVTYSINGAPPVVMDVVDDAGGDDVATTKVYTDVAPESDGRIHVDFTTAESFVNAIEILPGTPHQMLPVRIATGHSDFRDSAGNEWSSDRYFFGGRLSSIEGDMSKVADGRVYEWHRFGHFHYIVPVAQGGAYTVRLHFMEHWFGVQNGGIGGVGSRVFDVFCNGQMLLKDFDIFKEAGSAPLVKTFHHIQPTPQGKIELYFIPNVNYPSVSAIEVLPE